MRPSNSAYEAPDIFVAKKDGSIGLSMDYQALNKITLKGKYPLPIIENLLEQLAGAKYFSRIDLRLGNHQIRIAEDDIEKTAFRTRYENLKWLR